MQNNILHKNVNDQSKVLRYESEFPNQPRTRAHASAVPSERSKQSNEYSTREYHGDFFRPKEKWDRKPGDGRSSVATSSALEYMSMTIAALYQ